MSTIFMCLVTSAAIGAAPGTVTPRGAVREAAIDHPGDRRRYLAYPDKGLTLDVVPPATVEIVARAQLTGEAKRAKLRLQVTTGKQVLLEQSQVLPQDRRARGKKLTRPLVAVADIPPGTRRVTIAIEAPPDDVEAVVLAVTAVEISVSDAPGPDVNDDALVPDLVALGPSPAEPPPAAAAPAVDAPRPPPLAAASAPATPPYQASRYVGVELAAPFYLGLPGVELGARYYLPLLGERLSVGARLGYTASLTSAVLDPVVAPTQVRLTLHLLPALAFVEAEALRADVGVGRWYLGARLDGGGLLFAGSLDEELLLRGGKQRRTATPLWGLTWCAGGALTTGLDTALGTFAAELGYLHAPDAEARAEADPRRAIRTRVLGPRASLGYRFTF